MTTADIALGFSEFGWWLYGFEERAQRAAKAVAHWAVDAYEALARGLRRRRNYPASRHARSRHEGNSVWDYLHALPIEELKYVWKPRGQHRNNRGWRYGSTVWAVIERGVEYRAWADHWRAEVERLLDEIHYMIDHPPSAAEFTVHGCQDCICSQLREVREGLIA